MGVECPPLLCPVYRGVAARVDWMLASFRSSRQTIVVANIWAFGRCSGTLDAISARASPPRRDGDFGVARLDRRFWVMMYLARVRRSWAVRWSQSPP
jgi:hypothetical protein